PEDLHQPRARPHLILELRRVSERALARILNKIAGFRRVVRELSRDAFERRAVLPKNQRKADELAVAHLGRRAHRGIVAHRRRSDQVELPQPIDRNRVGHDDTTQDRDGFPADREKPSTQASSDRGECDPAASRTKERPCAPTPRRNRKATSPSTSPTGTRSCTTATDTRRPTRGSSTRRMAGRPVASTVAGTAFSASPSSSHPRVSGRSLSSTPTGRPRSRPGRS